MMETERGEVGMSIEEYNTLIHDVHQRMRRLSRHL